ncbi:EAL domain-containing protein [Amycolatopsis sp. NPDC051903]|uniref:EAL domain-containing protein n=1 Tax=Amycolatopsis sp. NPDC051903 TaxID=3363936 RepID=UPI0037BB0DCF
MASVLTAPTSPAELALVQAVDEELAATARREDDQRQPDIAADARPLPGEPTSQWPPVSDQSRWSLVLAIRLPHHSQPDTDLTVETTRQLHTAVARRAEGVLGGHQRLTILSDGADLLVNIPGSTVPGADLDLSETATKLASSLGEPYVLDGRRARVQPHFGVTIARPSADLAERAVAARVGLPDHVPISWTARPGSGTGTVALRPVVRLEQAHAAVAAGRCTVRYRRIEHTDAVGIAGVHAVPCWSTPAGTLHPLSELGSLADASRLTHLVFDRVLPEICRDLRVWRDQRLPHDPFVLLELPTAVLTDRYLADALAGHLHAVRVPAHMLYLGVRADALSLPGVDDHLYELADTGINLALTGYGAQTSPFNMLTRHPWTLAVIPRAVMDRALDDDRDRSTFAWLVKSAERFGAQILAEDIDLARVRRLLPDGLYVPTHYCNATRDDIAGELFRPSPPPHPPSRRSTFDEPASSVDAAAVPIPRS